MKIGLISTINSNIGDDFIRQGIVFLLKEIFNDKNIEFITVNKVQTHTAYPSWHPIQLTRISNNLPIVANRTTHIIEQFTSKIGNSYFDKCDLIVHCGSPVLWPMCHECIWADSIWFQIIGRLYNKIPIWNIAAGSCYPWENQPDFIANEDDKQFLYTITDYCKIVTVRDILARRLLMDLGFDAPFIPCPSIFASKNLETVKQNTNLFLINYMKNGGHFDWNQNINTKLWNDTIKSLIKKLSKRYDIAFLCHDIKEYNLAKQNFPGEQILFPQSIKDYFNMVLGARCAISNRMHSVMFLAGMGIPSIGVCTDTRLLMMDSVGLPNYYVKEVSPELLEERAELLISNFDAEKERLNSLKSNVWKQYIDIISESLTHTLR